MFSSRLPSELRPNRLTARLEELRHAGAAILDLTESNPTRAGLGLHGPEILAALADTRALVYEPCPAGLPVAREAIAAARASRGLTAAPERIVLTAGTSEAYGFLFRLLADPGEEILVPKPSYPLFDHLAALEGLRPVRYPLEHHGRWSVDLDALERAVTPRTRVLVVVHPNNPTGSFISRSEARAIGRIAERAGAAIVSDEVFSEFAFGEDPGRAASLDGPTGALTFCLDGVSKSLGLPQMKLAWIVVGGPPALRDPALERLEFIADAYLTVGTPAQVALPRLLALGEEIRGRILARLRRNLAAIGETLPPASPCRALEVEGGWYVPLRVPRVRTEEEWALDLLEREGVLVQPGYFYDFDEEAHLVVSLLAPEKEFREGLLRIARRAGAG